jgi:hypothetical protein
MYRTEYGAETKLNSMVDSLPDCYSRAHADKLSNDSYIATNDARTGISYCECLWFYTRSALLFFLLKTNVGALLKLVSLHTVFIGADLQQYKLG